MTSREFSAWISKACHLFPSLSGYFPLDEHDSKKLSPLAVERRDAWRAVLGDVDASDAAAALEAFVAGEPSLPYPSEVPAAVLVIVRDRRAERSRRHVPRRYVDGRETFRCLDCEDGGWVFCWHPRMVADVRRKGSFDGIVLYRCVVPCHCAAGSIYGIETKRAPALPRYNAAHWCRMAWIVEGDVMVPPNVVEPRQQAALLDWLADATRMTSYEPAFADQPDGRALAAGE